MCVPAWVYVYLVHRYLQKVKGHGIPWNWSHSQWWAALWVLGINPWSSARTTSTFNCRVFPNPIPIFFFLNPSFPSFSCGLEAVCSALVTGESLGATQQVLSGYCSTHMVHTVEQKLTECSRVCFQLRTPRFTVESQWLLVESSGVPSPGEYVDVTLSKGTCREVKCNGV